MQAHEKYHTWGKNDNVSDTMLHVVMMVSFSVALIYTLAVKIILTHRRRCKV